MFALKPVNRAQQEYRHFQEENTQWTSDLNGLSDQARYDRLPKGHPMYQPALDKLSRNRPLITGTRRWCFTGNWDSP